VTKEVQVESGEDGNFGQLVAVSEGVTDGVNGMNGHPRPCFEQG
jgi:hypothetical protein